MPRDASVDKSAPRARINIVAALGRNRVIGKGNRLLWHIPEDLKRFKRLTLGHPVIMGRKTFESILAALGTALPGRTNIVVTRDPSRKYPGALIVHSLEEALASARELDTEEIFIGGGAQLYERALPHADRLHLTLIDDKKEGDAFFPAYESAFSTEVAREEHEHNGLKYEWVDLEH